jgi:hypothetical protein
MKLKLKETFTDYQRDQKYTVERAVENKLQDTFADGKLEELKDEIENQRDMIAKLVEILHVARIISKEDLLEKLLKGRFEEVEEN